MSHTYIPPQKTYFYTKKYFVGHFDLQSKKLFLLQSILDTTLGGTGGTQSTSTASNRFRKYPHNYIYGGFTGGLTTGCIDIICNRTTYGYYWSAKASSANYAYVLYLNSVSVSPGTVGSSKFVGRAVR